MLEVSQTLKEKINRCLKNIGVRNIFTIFIGKLKLKNKK